MLISLAIYVFLWLWRNCIEEELKSFVLWVGAYVAVNQVLKNGIFHIRVISCILF